VVIHHSLNHTIDKLLCDHLLLISKSFKLHLLLVGIRLIESRDALPQSVDLILGEFLIESIEAGGRDEILILHVGTQPRRLFHGKQAWHGKEGLGLLFVISCNVCEAQSSRSDLCFFYILA